MARPSSVSNVSRLATSTTLIPEAAICRANSLPIPDEAPVTSAHGPNCPLSSAAFIVLFLSVDCTCCSVHAFIPPSTVRFAPVMYEDSGPATNATNAHQHADVGPIARQFSTGKGVSFDQAAQLTHAQVRVLFLPRVEGGFAH